MGIVTKTSLFMYFVFKCVGSIRIFSALCLMKVVAASLLQKERFHREILARYFYVPYEEAQPNSFM